MSLNSPDAESPAGADRGARPQLIALLSGLAALIDTVMQPIEKNTHVITYVLSGLMALPITADVLMRLILDRSVPGVIEIQEFGLVMIIFLGLSEAANLNQHIRIDLFVERFPKWLKNWLDNAIYLITALLFALTTWQTVLTTLKKASVRSTTYDIPISVFIAITAVGLFFLALTLVKKYLQTTVAIIKDRQSPILLVPLLLGAAFLLLPLYVKSIPVQMSGLALGSLAILCLFILIILGMPLGFAMMLVGYVGLFIFKKNSLAVFGMLGATPYFQTANYIFVVLPMFMLMGSLTYYSGISRDLFNAAQKWLGRVPGGLAVSSVVGCAGFAAVSGDSMATAVTMGTVAFPEMKKNNYDASIASGCLAAGGTLGILIPPSLGFIIYAIITEESVGKLFVAGILPGVLLTLLFVACIVFLAKKKPHLFPRGEHYPLKERLHSLKGIWAIVLLFLLIIGGMLRGIFSSTEAGAIGAFGAFCIAFLRSRISRSDFIKALKETASISARMFVIIIGVGIIGYLLAATQFPNQLAKVILGLGVGKYAIFAAVCVLYLILGALMNVMPMIMLTLPAIFPSIVALGFDPIWFGVEIVLLMEMGQITPPVGMNVFTISTVTGTPMATVFKGITPFLVCMALCLIILAFFPQIALILVRLLF